MEPISSNGFGSDTYWNRPTSRGRKNRPSRSLSPTRLFSDERSSSIASGQSRPADPPTLLFTARPVEVKTASVSNIHNGDSKVHADTSLNLQRSRGVSRTSTVDMSLHNHYRDLDAEFDVKDEKAMVKLMKSNLPQFSNETDWEMAAFELILVLDRIWPHKQALDIAEYLRTTYSHYDKDMEKRPDSLIYLPSLYRQKKTPTRSSKLWPLVIQKPFLVSCKMKDANYSKCFNQFSL